MLTERKTHGSPDPDMTPMIDCVFNLLIFFMVINTMSSIIGIKIDLPAEGSAVASAGAESLEVEVYRDTLLVDPERGPEVARKGILKLNGQPVGLEQLSNNIKYTVSHMAQPQDTLVIRAQAETIHGTVVEVMDKAQSPPAQIRKFSFSDPME